MTDAPPRRWVAVAAAVAGIAVVGAAAVTKSAALALATRNPDTALKLDPGNSIALSQAALRDIQLAKTPAQRDAAANLARRAIADDAANSTAVSALALATDEPKAAYRALRVSEALSRRSLLTQLALIEQAVARNDVVGALAHYDIALRTSTGSAAILFPVLVEATTDRALLGPIAGKLLARPEWGELYTQQLAQTGTDLGNVTTLFTTMTRRGVAPPVAATAALYQRLLDAHDYGHAWQLYAASHRGAARGGVRAGGGDPAAGPTPFDWNVSVDGPVTGEVRSTDAGGAELAFASAIGDGGTAARQLLLLPPGRHVIRGAVETSGTRPPAGPNLRLDCAATAIEIGRQPLASGGFQFAFNVPQGCVAQWLSVNVRSGDTSTPAEGTLRSLRID